MLLTVRRENTDLGIKPIRNKWKSTMTDRERFNNQMHYKSVDRCFNMEFGYWDENFILWDIFAGNGIKNNEEADLFFSFDTLKVCRGNIDIYPGFPREVVDETETTRIIMNKDGLLAEVQRMVRYHSAFYKILYNYAG